MAHSFDEHLARLGERTRQLDDTALGWLATFLAHSLAREAGSLAATRWAEQAGALLLAERRRRRDALRQVEHDIASDVTSNWSTRTHADDAPQPDTVAIDQDTP